MTVPENIKIEYEITKEDSQDFDGDAKFLRDFKVNQTKLREFLQAGKLMYFENPEGKQILAYVEGNKLLGEKDENGNVKLIP